MEGAQASDSGVDETLADPQASSSGHGNASNPSGNNNGGGGGGGGTTGYAIFSGYVLAGAALGFDSFLLLAIAPCSLFSSVTDAMACSQSKSVEGHCRLPGGRFSSNLLWLALHSTLIQCKRLKLKCDRKFPCASCLKRNTVERCLYSAAAAEKV